LSQHTLGVLYHILIFAPVSKVCDVLADLLALDHTFIGNLDLNVLNLAILFFCFEDLVSSSFKL
jgi:hypothetical protein